MHMYTIQVEIYCNLNQYTPRLTTIYAMNLWHFDQRIVHT